jgi:putative SOS response-associated peptidase YedK
MFRLENQRRRRRPLFDIGELRPNYNLCPTHRTPVVFIKDGECAIDLMRWGLVPFWAADVKSADKYSLINAKAEEIETKRSYSAAFKQRRCLVPVSGFFEWKREGRTKTPFAIHLKDRPILLLAGVWERWASKDTGETVNSFAILTTASNSFMDQIHTRMPLILDPIDEPAWLDPESDLATIRAQLHPCPSDWLECFQVSTLVNSPKNNRAEILQPVEKAAQGCPKSS